MEPAAGDRKRVTLSTGHEIDLPLELAFAVGGLTVPARRGRLEALLPDALSPLAIAPGVGCVTLVGIQYHRVGGGRGGDGRGDEGDGDATTDTGLEPYDEFGVVVPAVRGSRSELPFAPLFGGELGGYVHWLPVTTEPSVALGREIWGYPKERADITVTDGPRGLRAVVRGVDGPGAAERVRLEVPRPRSSLGTGRRDWTLWSYTTKDGELLRTRAEIRGEVTLGTPAGATLELEPDLRSELGCWNRPIARLYGSRVRARLHRGEPVGES